MVHAEEILMIKLMGVIIEYENISKEYFGGEKNTTNNKMELKMMLFMV